MARFIPLTMTIKKNQIESIYESALCELEDLLLVCQLLSAMETGSWPPNSVTAPVFTMQSCWSDQYEGGLPLPPDGLFFYEVHMEVFPPPSWGQSPTPCWPLCLFSAVLIQQRSLPAEQQIRDLVTLLLEGRGSVVTTVIGSPYILSIIHLRTLIGQACHERDRARDYGMRKGPGEETQSEYGNFTADTKREKEKLLF